VERRVEGRGRREGRKKREREREREAIVESGGTNYLMMICHPESGRGSVDGFWLSRRLGHSGTIIVLSRPRCIPSLSAFLSTF
jgi:hypothetical protein